MNGIHDLGGMHGFGAVAPQAGEPVFHQQWEREVFASVIALMAQGVYNLDEFRHGVERIGHRHYLNGSYYEHWLDSAQLLLREKGIIDEAEWAARVGEIRDDPERHRPAHAGDEQLAPALAQGIRAGLPTLRAIDPPPRFQVGDAVTTRNLQPAGHIRLPAYARNRTGRIERAHGAFVLPDSHAHGHGEQPQYLYAVRFDHQALWGDSRHAPRCSNIVDLWESYLDGAAA